VTVEDRVPVVVAAGEVIERSDQVTAVDLAERAAAAALAQAGALRSAVGRLSVVNLLSPTGPAPATALASRLGLSPAVRETTTIGGNSPQMLVTRAAADIAAGRLEATLIVGAEALRSARAGNARPPADTLGDPDAVIGDGRPGTGGAEDAIGLILPVYIYAMFESAVAARAGRSLGEHRSAIGQLLSPFSDVAASRPCAWFQDKLSPSDISEPSGANRVVAEPYTKRMTAFPNVDQGAALLVCSLAAARRAGAADQAVFVWSGAGCNDVWEPSARPDLTASPAIAAAAEASLRGGGVGVGDLRRLDLYSCFPAAVEAAADAVGVDLDDRRGLTVTGGLPFFGGPGNNYSTHAIAAMAESLRGGDRGALGLVGALGWYTTKHSYGLYGASPPPNGFVAGDTAASQRRIDGSALPVAGTADGHATVDAATVCYTGERVTSAPVIATLDEGPRVVADAHPDRLAELAGQNLVGRRVRVAGRPPAYEVIE
jgi:acetyl-CoA C-acetyltransferase